MKPPEAVRARQPRSTSLN